MKAGRSDLRISDLKARIPTPSRLMNVRLPSDLWDAINRMARELGASKTQVVLALLNTGLDVAQNKLGRPASRG